MKKNIRYIFLLMTIVSVLVIGSGCDLFIKTNDGKVDLKWYMGLTYEDANGNDQPYNTLTGGQVAAVALEDGYSEEYAIVKGKEAYVNIDTVKANVDDRFYWDKNEDIIMFTNAKAIYKIKIGEKKLSGASNDSLDYDVALLENEKCYINMKFVTKFIDMDYKAYEESGSMPARVVLKYSNGEKTIMSTSKKIEMRTKGDYQNMIVTTVDKGTKVTVIETGKNWYKVSTEDGFIGYIPVKKLKDKKTEKAEYKSDKKEYTHVTLNKQVCLVWNQIYNQSANNNYDTLMEHTAGVNVISPTWFSLTDKKGNLSTLADLNYVEKAHKKGIQVWALVNDFSDKKLTKTVLTTTAPRQNLIKNIMFFMNSYDLDGINIDFEYITEDIIDSYLQFLRELSIECRKAKKILSIDNYAPAQWSEYYDREQQALLADYIIIMNYDEHTTGSKEAGSVSSLGYAETAIKDTIAQTGDPARVINGMPFYTRVWKETPEEDSDGKGVLVQDAANGNYYLSCEAVGMDKAKKAYEDAGVKPTLDSTTGQNFVTYSKGKSTYMIWLEDQTSVKARLELMNKYKLGGAAYWALGQETDSIWKTISEYFK